MTEVERRGIEKAKVGLVVCAVLVAVLAVSNVWFYTELQNRNTLHSSQIDSLSRAHQDYVATHSYSNSEYDSLQFEYDDYVATHHYSDSEYNETQFSFYYVKPKEQKFGVYNLSDELSGLEWLHPYQEEVFDCSEMSAYLEWHLENEGWHAIIVAGDSPFGSGKHAWLLVETSQGRHMPVESTNIEVVWWDDPYFDNYFIYHHEFGTIQEAIAYNESEFDWWK